MPHVSQSFQTWKTTYPCVHKFYKLEENDSCVPNLACHYLYQLGLTCLQTLGLG